LSRTLLNNALHVSLGVQSWKFIDVFTHCYYTTVNVKLNSYPYHKICKSCYFARDLISKKRLLLRQHSHAAGGGWSW